MSIENSARDLEFGCTFAVTPVKRVVVVPGAVPEMESTDTGRFGNVHLEDIVVACGTLAVLRSKSANTLELSIWSSDVETCLIGRDGQRIVAVDSRERSHGTEGVLHADGCRRDGMIRFNVLFGQAALCADEPRWL